MIIIAASDSHRSHKRLKALEKAWPQASLFLFAGDYGADPNQYDHWIGVLGNNDLLFKDQIPLERVVIAENHRIYLCHGHLDPPGKRVQRIAAKALENDCDIAIYGHSHVSGIQAADGVLVINPGSLYRNRDGKMPSYCLLKLEGDLAEAEIKYWPDLNIED